MPDKSYISGNVENGPIFDILVGNLLAYRPEEWGWSEQDYQKISSDFGVAENDLYHLPVANYVILNYPDNLLPSGANTDVEDYRLQVYSIQSDELTKYLLLYIGNRIYKATITAIGQTPNWEDITEYGADGLKIISFHIGDKAPSDTSKIWIDTSKLVSDGYITLFFYDAASGEWKNYYVNGLMDKSIYDTQNKNTDPFLYVMDQIEAIIGDYAEFIRHKNNELTLIHVTSEEKEYYNTQLISKEDLKNMFSPGGSVYEELLTYIKNSASDKFNIDKFTDDINGIKEKLQNHIDNHITAEKVTSWINKADGDHKHNQDGKVTIHGTDIKGDPYTSDQLPDNIKERVTIVNSEDERLALTIDQVQNGDAVCVEDTDGNLVWYRVIDDTKLGVEYAEESKWKETSNGLSERNWRSICYGNDKYVVVSSDSNTFAYSTDGITWTETSNGLNSRSWRSICYGNDKYVAVAYNSNTFAYSTDGINWTETSNGINQVNWYSICYGNGKYVAVSGNSNTFAYSIDGINWTENSNGLSKRKWVSICYGKDKYVAVANHTNSFYIAYSTNGINWTEINTGLSLAYARNICYGNGKYVAISYANTFAYSIDGIHWTEINNELDIGYWIFICYGNGKYVVVAEYQNTFAYSTDGITWIGTTNGLSSQHWQSICYGNDKYVAISSSNTFAYWNGSLGNEEAFIKFTSTLLETSFSNIKNKPTTLEGYGITDGADKSKLDAIEERIENNLENLIYVPNGYDNTSIGENELYVGVQKSLSAEGGGTVENPMSYNNSLLDVITCINSSDEIMWKETSNGISTSNWNSICYGNNKYVAVAFSDNTFAYSTDGIHWTETSNGLSKEYWYSICYGNGKYVAVAYSSNKFAYSSDGINWTETSNGLSKEYWQSICYGNGKYVAVSSNSNIFAYSTDGINWTENSKGLSNNSWSSICYGNGKYVAVAQNSNTFAYSSDGINWTETSNGLSEQQWMSICYGNGKYVAVSSNVSNTFAYSTNGINWTETSTGLSKEYWQSICYGNGKYVVVVWYSNTFTYSSDGINWTETSNGLSERSWQSICYGNGKYVAVSDSNTFAYSNSNIKIVNKFAHLPENQQHIYLQESIYISDSGHSNNVCYGNGKYVAVAYSSNKFAYSTDGINWTETSTGLSKEYWQSICYGNGKYVVVVWYSNTFTYSSDGINWTETSNGLSERSWQSICYGNGKFVAIAWNSNTFAYSSDGINWTETSNGLSEQQWMSICYGNGKYVAVSSNVSNTFAYSTNGINWTETSTGLSNRLWLSICYGNGKYVAVAQNSNTFAYSTDGINWIETSNGLSNRLWLSICYGNGKYVAVAQNSNTFAYSTDGINWTENSNGISDRDWLSVCYGNNKYIICGNSDIIENVYFLETPETVGGFAKFPTTYTKDDYFSTLYQTDEENPKYTSDGLGMMVKVDTTQNNIVCDKTYNIGDKAIKLLIGYDIEKGLYFKTEMGETVKSLNSMYDVLMRVGDPLLALLNGYKAKFPPSQYTITFKTEIGGKINNGTDDITYTLESGQPFPEIPSVTSDSGYKFDNWYDSSNHKVTSWPSTVTKNETYTAKYNVIPKYTITFNAGSNCSLNGGNKTYTVLENDPFPAIPTIIPNSEYEIDGWYDSDNIKVVSWPKTVTKSETYTAKVTAIPKYTITFKTDGNGTLSGTTSFTLLRGSKFPTVPTNTPNSGYKFDGWYSSTGTKVTSWPSAVTKSETYIAKYIRLKIKWYETSNGLSDRDWNSICYGNGKYVAVVASYSNTFAYSTDGIAWTETSNGLSNRSWYSICYGNGKYVAVSGYSSTFAYSTNGINWTENSNGLSYRTWRSICYGNGKYVAVAYSSNTFAYSTDGINWTETSTGIGDRHWWSICYGNGKFVAIATNSNVFAYSSDGINWTETTNGLSTRNWYSICYGKDKYVAVVQTSNTFAYSTNGINWTENSNGLSYRTWHSICYGNGKYVAICGGVSSNAFAYSIDGINWTETSNGLSSRNWMSICYGNGKYVAVAYNSNTFAYSTLIPE